MPHGHAWRCSPACDRVSSLASSGRHVDLDQGFITLPDTKAGMVQYVHLNEEAKSILRGMQAIAEAEATADQRKRSEWVYPSENPATAIDPRNFYVRIYVPAVEAANLKGLTWHAL